MRRTRSPSMTEYLAGARRERGQVGFFQSSVHVWLYTVLDSTSAGNRLALLIAGLRVIGFLGFAVLGGYYVIQDAYLEATLSVVTILAWIAATTEAMDWVLERYSWRLNGPTPPPLHHPLAA